MDNNYSKILKNARIVLEVSCDVKKNEKVAILVHERDSGFYQVSKEDAQALAIIAVQMQAYPVIININEYGTTDAFKKMEIFEPVRGALMAADVVIGTFGDYVHLGCNKSSADTGGDEFHTESKRWFSLQRHMDKWDINAEEIAEIPRRTEWLRKKLDSTREIRVTTNTGTDFTCSPGKYNLVIRIIPNYAEIAVTPQQGTENGVIVVDGATSAPWDPGYPWVRRFDKLDREPLRINVKSGEVQDCSGDPEQVKNLEQFLKCGSPPARYIDEVGIPTSRVKANDICWSDGTHSIETIHIALGNNIYRDELIHGKIHMDMEIIKPSIFLDDEIIMKDSVFVNE